jgi:hypothetical protein
MTRTVWVVSFDDPWYPSIRRKEIDADDDLPDGGHYTFADAKREAVEHARMQRRHWEGVNKYLRKLTKDEV